MSEASDRYRRISGEFASKIAGVPPDRWNDPTPCTEWTVRDLVRHVVYMNGVHFDRVGRQPRPGPSVEDDPLGAFNAVREQVQADLDDPARANVEFDGPMGRCTFAEAIDRFICFEILVHGWDLARATGQDERIDPDDVAWLWKAVELAGESAVRDRGVCGPAVEPAADADEQARLLTYLGREV